MKEAEDSGDFGFNFSSVSEFYKSLENTTEENSPSEVLHEDAEAKDPEIGPLIDISA